MPASASQKLWTMTLRSDHDAPLANQSWYATPATLVHDDNLSSSKDEKDAPPASIGQYAMPATPGCDDESAANHQYQNLLQLYTKCHWHRITSSPEAT